MAGSGRAPKPESHRRNHHAPTRGEWKQATDIGWQHGSVPKPPPNLTKVSRETWATWFGAWWAAFWTPEDLPMLRQVIALYDKIERNDASAAELSQFRQLVDTYGITPKGQQDRRWAKPAEEAPKATTGTSSKWRDLKVV